jgi:hypothetical protein
MHIHADESAGRCPTSKPTARVEDSEDVALIVCHDLLCDEKGKPTEGAFPFSQLLLKSTDSERFPHNKCGESEGVSIERDISAREGELLERCKVIASKKSTPVQQTPMGFA